jgi:hypothetical protein
MLDNVVIGALGVLVVAAGAVAFAMSRRETSVAAKAVPFGIETIVGLVLFLGAIGGSAFKLPGWPGEVPVSTNASVNPDAVLPTRMAAGPGQYPPSQFKAYGIVAFKTGPTAADKDRYDMICDAYVSSLPFYKDVKAPPERQMVTVWPVEKPQWADKINAEARQKVCADAVAHYGVALAQDAIREARQNGAGLDGQGPFLLAWSPGVAKGRKDALVLVADLSDVIVNEQAKQVFALWALDIQNDPGLWDPTWNVEKILLRARLWADKVGTTILNIYKSKS